MKKNTIISSTLAILLSSFTLAGCDISPNATLTGNAVPFYNKLNIDKILPNPRFNPVSASLSIYDEVRVYDSNGKQITLNASQQPTLFEAYWCPHCQRTLVMLNKNRSQLHDMPVIVSMGFAGGTSLSEAIKLSHQEFNAFHITNVKVYYLLDDKEDRLLAPQYPTLVFPYHKQVLRLSGEHEFYVWRKAVNQK